jgi:hypothetical protein
VAEQVRPALAGSLPLGRIGLACRRRRHGGRRWVGPRGRRAGAFGTGGVRIVSIAVNAALYVNVVLSKRINGLQSVCLPSTYIGIR